MGIRRALSDAVVIVGEIFRVDDEGLGAGLFRGGIRIRMGRDRSLDSSPVRGGGMFVDVVSGKNGVGVVDGVSESAAYAGSRGRDFW